MKKIEILLVVFVLAVMLSFVLVTKVIRAANNEAAVSATVTVENIAVALEGTDGSIVYGTMGVGTSKTTLQIGSTDTEVVKNTGNNTEKFRIKGADTTGCVWGLGAAIGVGDTYVHKFSTAHTQNGSFTALTLSYADLTASAAVGVTQPIDFMMIVPSSSSCYTTSTAGVTVLAESLL
jgi:hypothetical protein